MKNLLINSHPQLKEEWLSEKNLSRKLSLESITKGSKKEAWWQCKTCNSEYTAKIQNRTAKRPTGCPYCGGKLVNHTNNLELLYPSIAKEWNYGTNLIKPSEVTPSSDKVVGFLKKSCGHSWYAKIKDRVKNNTGCPVCKGKHIQIGFNDLNTTHPNIANLVFNKENKYKYSYGSGKKIDWFCPTCNIKIAEKSIKNIVKDGLSCVLCSPYSSKSERLFGTILNELGVDFIPEYNSTWSKRKLYDFFLPQLNTIVELHGSQHYGDTFNHKGARTFEEEKQNDIEKRELALANGIDHYIEIDTSSEMMESKLEAILNDDELNHLIKSLVTIDKNDILLKYHFHQTKIQK